MPTMKLSREFYLRAMHHDAVKKALKLKADRIQAEAKKEAKAQGVRDLEVEVSEGTRPQGRPYARVSVDLEDEWGSYKKPKLRILGRLQSVHNNPR